MNLRNILPLALLLFTAMPAIAQDDDGPPIPSDRLEEIKAQKAAFITQRMNLTPEEAQKFWPVYNQYDREMEDLRKERRDAMKTMRKGNDGLTEAQASDNLDKELAMRQKELDVRRKYVGEFKKSVGALKTLELGRAERDFNRELLKRMGEHRGDGDRRREGPPPGKSKF